MNVALFLAIAAVLMIAFAMYAACRLEALDDGEDCCGEDTPDVLSRVHAQSIDEIEQTTQPQRRKT